MTEDAVEQVRSIASNVFNMLAQEESPGAPPESVVDWDSMQRLNLVLALEEHFGVEFTPEEIEKMKTLVEYAATIDGKLEQHSGRSQGAY